MSWRDILRPASFRGVAFFVDTAELSAGRRAAVHEYPGRDVPYVEDLGRKARTYTVTAHLIGDNYIAARDSLIAALEKVGPGILIHPTLGSVSVQATDFTQTFSNTQGGIETLSMTFVEAGKNQFPGATVDPAGKIGAQVSKAKNALGAGFNSFFTTNKLPGFVSQNAQSLWTAAASSLGGLPVSALAISNFTSTLPASVPAPSTLSAGWLSLMSQSFNLSNYAGLRGLLNFTRPPVQQTTPARRQEAKNQAASLQLIQGSAITEMARLVPDIPFASYQEAVGFRDQLSADIEPVLLLAADSGDDETFAALSDLNALVIADITGRAGSLAKVKTFSTARPTPALALAYRLYQDSGRDEELIARNRAGNPLFMPPELQVLTA